MTGSLLGDLDHLAATWSGLMLRALLDGSLVFLLALGLWWLLRKRAPAQLGYGLFLLVLLKVALPLQVAAPGWLAGLSPGAWVAAIVDGPALPAPDLKVAAVTGAAGGLPPPPAAVPSPDDPRLWWFLVWAAVVAALTLRFALLQWRTIRLVAAARRPRARELPVDWRALQDRIGLRRRRVRLLVSGAVHSPAAGGLWRPYVLLPEGLISRLEPRALSWVLLHELAHVRRRDAWVALLQRSVQIAFFFHPAVWLANRIVDEQREFACDDLALAACGQSRRACGEGFLSVVEWSQGREPEVPALALGAFRFRHLTRRRLMRILDARHRPGARSALFSGLFVAALGALLVPDLQAQGESLSELEQQIRQQEIAILEAKLAKLALESEWIRREIARLRGGGAGAAGRTDLERANDAIGIGRGAGGRRAPRGGGRGPRTGSPRPPRAPEAPQPRRANPFHLRRPGAGAPRPDRAPEAVETPREVVEIVEVGDPLELPPTVVEVVEVPEPDVVEVVEEPPVVPPPAKAPRPRRR